MGEFYNRPYVCPPRSLRSLSPRGRASALRAAGRALMAVWALGLNHTTAPLDMRGRFAYAIDQLEPTLRGLREALMRPEAAILSTCNRTEIYCAGDRGDMDRTFDWLAHSGGVSTELLRSHAYTLHDAQA